MKKLILSLIISIYITGVYGQQRKSITDTIFPLEQANVYGTLKHKVNLLNLDVPLKIFTGNGYPFISRYIGT